MLSALFASYRVGEDHAANASAVPDPIELPRRIGRIEDEVLIVLESEARNRELVT